MNPTLPSLLIYYYLSCIFMEVERITEDLPFVNQIGQTLNIDER